MSDYNLRWTLDSKPVHVETCGVTMDVPVDWYGLPAFVRYKLHDILGLKAIVENKVGLKSDELSIQFDDPDFIRGFEELVRSIIEEYKAARVKKVADTYGNQ